MNRKAEMTMSMFVKVAAITFGAVVFLIVLWPVISGTMKGAGKTGECNWNMFLATLTKQVTMGFGEIPIGCQAEHTTVDSKTIDKMSRLANKRITKYCGLAQAEDTPYVGLATAATSQYYAQAADEFCETGKPTYDDRAEWALDYIIAKKLANCWNKVWHGKLDFFTGQFLGDRVFCVVCDIVSFSEDLPVVLQNQEAIDSLYEFTNAEAHYKTTYYNYITEDATRKLSKNSMAYTTKVPIAITYVNTKKSTLGTWIGGITGGIAGLFAGSAVGLTAVGLAIIWIPGPGWVAGPAILTVAALGAGAAVGGAAAGAAGGAAAGTAATAAIVGGEIKELVIHPEQLLNDPIKYGGLGCTDIVG